MKRWPLRWKIALYAAVLGVFSTLAGAVTTWLIMHYWEVARFDRRLNTDAQELFRDIHNFAGGGAGQGNMFGDNLVPLALRNRLIEVRGADGDLLYHSPMLLTSVNDDGNEAIHTRTLAGERVRMGTFRENGLTAYVGADAREVDQIGGDILLGMLGAIPTVLIVVVLGGRWIARQALAPIDAIRQAAGEISVEHLDQRLPVPAASDEIAGLIGVLNSMLDRLQRSFEQSMRFSAEASHQLKTPLSVMRADIEALLTDPNTPGEQQERVEQLLHQTHQLTSIAEKLLLLARADAGRLELQRKPFNLSDLLDGVCDDARALADPHRLTVEAKMPPQILMEGDRPSVALILQNLVENAVKYNRPDGFICIEAEPTNGQVKVIVRNTGEPIPPDRIPHIFERFYRARIDGRIPGPGLGLSLASELTKAHGGSLDLVRSDSQWTEFRLLLKRM
jgi:signal transduction histidine kinase